MSISLVKGQKISLAKQDGSSLSKIFLGAGWDVAKSGGMFGLFGGGNKSIDLDVSVITFDANKKQLDNVYFGQLRSRDGSIVHSGDNLTGAGEGDDEVIHVDLSQVPSNVQSIVFTISSFRGQTFDEVENAFCRIVDQSNKELAIYKLNEKGSHTGVLISSLKRNGGAWDFTARGLACRGRMVNDMIPQITAEIL